MKRPHTGKCGAAVALMQAGSIRQITATQKTILTPMLDKFPQNFTLESEVFLQKEGRQGWYFYPAGSDEDVLEFWTEDRAETNLRIYVHSKDEMLNDSEVALDFSQPVKQALWIQNGRLRIYINGKKAVDVNQVQLPPLRTAQLWIEPYGFRPFVTHGLHFDTDSDRLQPDSAAVLKSIATGLQQNPNLRLCIEGHTDFTGNPGHNLDLSKRRAEAVRAVLVSQFGVEANRLTTDGFGASSRSTPMTHRKDGHRTGAWSSSGNNA